MLYNLRTGDIILAKNKNLNQTNVYLLAFEPQLGYGLYCITCGNPVGFYGKDKKLLEKELKEFYDIEHIVPKELMIDYFNNNFKLEFPVRMHDTSYPGDELNIEFELVWT